MNEQLLAVARDACVELMRSGLRAQNLAPSLFASVKLASYKEYVAVERGLVSADLAAHATTGNRRKESPVTAETRDRLVRISVLQEAALQSFQAFAPKPLLTSFSRHAAKPCVHDAVVLRTELLDGTSNPPPTHDEWFELQSCRVDSLQGLMDEIQTTIIADAKASQSAALKRLAYLGMPLLLLCFCAATVGLRALTGLVTYQERVSEKLRKLKSSEGSTSDCYWPGRLSRHGCAPSRPRTTTTTTTRRRRRRGDDADDALARWPHIGHRGRRAHKIARVVRRQKCFLRV